jgi:hypothetical protein
MADADFHEFLIEIVEKDEVSIAANFDYPF